MKNIIECLVQIEKAARNSDTAKVKAVIQSTRKCLAGTAPKELLGKLDGELEVWQTKLSVILKEPAGREGMARHAKHWVEQLRSLRGTQ